ncbi:MAG: M23 family metallopeptidase, partial [Arenimonas sp.]
THGSIGGFFIRPDQSAAQMTAPSTHLDYQTRTSLRLPFEDEFHVFWGGRTIEQNYHAADGNQRFALDLLILRAGASHNGGGRRNEDYYCFGKPVLAPAAGKVLEVVDGTSDNVPGQMNPKTVTGNRVIINHGSSEYSVLAHLRNGSLRVKSGDTVQAGDRVGDCGNSGNSSEPHLHYQLQDGPAFGTSAGLPAQFSNYVADDKPVARGEPTRGQRIRPTNHL